MDVVWIAKPGIPPRAMGRKKSTSMASKFRLIVGRFWHRRETGNCHL